MNLKEYAIYQKEKMEAFLNLDDVKKLPPTHEAKISALSMLKTAQSLEKYTTSKTYLFPKLLYDIKKAEKEAYYPIKMGIFLNKTDDAHSRNFAEIYRDCITQMLRTTGLPINELTNKYIAKAREQLTANLVSTQTEIEQYDRAHPVSTEPKPEEVSKSTMVTTPQPLFLVRKESSTVTSDPNVLRQEITQLQKALEPFADFKNSLEERDRLKEKETQLNKEKASFQATKKALTTKQTTHDTRTAKFKKGGLFQWLFLALQRAIAKFFGTESAELQLDEDNKALDNIASTISQVSLNLEKETASANTEKQLHEKNLDSCLLEANEALKTTSNIFPEKSVAQFNKDSSPKVVQKLITVVQENIVEKEALLKELLKEQMSKPITPVIQEDTPTQPPKHIEEKSSHTKSSHSTTQQTQDQGKPSEHKHSTQRRILNTLGSKGRFIGSMGKKTAQTLSKGISRAVPTSGKKYFSKGVTAPTNFFHRNSFSLSRRPSTNGTKGSRPTTPTPS